MNEEQLGWGTAKENATGKWDGTSGTKGYRLQEGHWQEVGGCGAERAALLPQRGPGWLTPILLTAGYLMGSGKTVDTHDHQPCEPTIIPTRQRMKLRSHSQEVGKPGFLFHLCLTL